MHKFFCPAVFWIGILGTVIPYNLFYNQCGSWIDFANDFKYNDGYICAQLRTDTHICNKIQGKNDVYISEICEYKYVPDCYFTNGNINVCLEANNGKFVLTKNVLNNNKFMFYWSKTKAYIALFQKIFGLYDKSSYLASSYNTIFFGTNTLCALMYEGQESSYHSRKMVPMYYYDVYKENCIKYNNLNYVINDRGNLKELNFTSYYKNKNL